MSLFVDSGAFLGLLSARDPYHPRAFRFLRRWRGGKLLTSNFVLDEVATRGAQLVGAEKAATYVRGILDSPLHHVMDVSRELLIASLERFVKYEDQGLSLTDCSNVVIMEAAGIRSIFTFDSGFRRIGLEMVP